MWWQFDQRQVDPNRRPLSRKVISNYFLFVVGIINDVTYVQCPSVAIVYVTLGAHNVDNDKEIHQENYRSRDYYIHPDWDSNTLQGDIGLIRLPQSIDFSGI